MKYSVEHLVLVFNKMAVFSFSLSRNDTNFRHVVTIEAKDKLWDDPLVIIQLNLQPYSQILDQHNYFNCFEVLHVTNCNEESPDFTRVLLEKKSITIQKGCDKIPKKDFQKTSEGVYSCQAFPTFKKICSSITSNKQK